MKLHMCVTAGGADFHIIIPVQTSGKAILNAAARSNEHTAIHHDDRTFMPYVAPGEVLVVSCAFDHEYYNIIIPSANTTLVLLCSA